MTFLSLAAPDRWFGEPLAATLAAPLVGALGTAVLLHGPDGVIRSCNAAAPDLLGADAPALLGSRFEAPRWRCVRPDGGHLADQDRPAALTRRTGQPQPAMVMGVRRDDGAVVWVSATTALIADAPGNARSVVVSLVDVSDRLHAEVRAARAERQLHAVLAVAPVGLFTANAGGRITSVNSRWREITGLAEDHSPAAIEALVHPEDRYLVLGRWRASLRTGSPFSCRYRGVTAVGETRWLDVRAEPQRDDVARVVGWAGTLNDVSATVADEVQVREELNRAEAFAADLRRLHDDNVALFQTVVHDLDAPLAAIRILAETLEHHGEQLGADRVQTALARIRTQARMAKGIVVDLLSAERVALDRQTTLRELCRLDELVAATVEECDLTGRALALDLEAITASVDRAQLARVVANLVGNAAKHTPSFTPVDVRLIRTARGIELEVGDRGPGIPPELRSRMFERFERGPGSSGLPGTGVGLYVVRRFVELHGGTVSVRDRPNGGALFQVVLPEVAPSEGGLAGPD
ncbi:MAG: ATP-binding protein [Acidimicrobiales bacterium]